MVQVQAANQAQNAPQTKFVTQAPRSAKIVNKVSPNLMRTKTTVFQFQVGFITFFQQPSKITLMSLNIGKTCVVGKDCPTDQICDTTKNCVSCGESSKPNESQSKCNGSSRCLSILPEVILALVSVGVIHPLLTTRIFPQCTINHIYCVKKIHLTSYWFIKQGTPEVSDSKLILNYQFRIIQNLLC